MIKIFCARGLFFGLIGALFLCSINAFAEGSDSDEGAANVAETLQNLLDGLKSFDAEFEQSTTEADGYLLDEQQGQIYFSRPDKVRWESLAPYEQTLVADGSDIYLYDPDLNQVTIRPWNNDPAQNPAAVFVGGDDLASHFNVSQVSVAVADAEVIHNSYRLEPLQGSSLVEIIISFYKEIPVSMNMLDNLGQRTDIRFINARLDVDQDPSVFTFDIPQGAEIITDG